jgi:hypothetical protein
VSVDSFDIVTDFLRHRTMTSKQKRRTPHNIYTEKRAEREFQDFIQHSKSKNVPIPDRLLATSKPPQDTNENAPAAPKRQKLTPPEVHQHFLFSNLVISNLISLARVEPNGCTNTSEFGRRPRHLQPWC